MTNKFLTNAAYTQTIRPGEELQLSFITDAASIYVWYQQYNLIGVPSAPASLAIKTMEYVGETYRQGIIPINSNMFSASNSKITLWVTDSNYNTISNLITFNIDNNCYKTPIRLAWLNTLGGMDFYTFFATEIEEINIERLKYKTDGVKKNFGIKASNALKLQAKYESEDVVQWLNELFYSPEVYIVDTAFTPVIVTQGKTIVSSLDLFALTCNIEKQDKVINQ